MATGLNLLGQVLFWGTSSFPPKLCSGGPAPGRQPFSLHAGKHRAPPLCCHLAARLRVGVPFPSSAGAPLSELQPAWFRPSGTAAAPPALGSSPAECGCVRTQRPGQLLEREGPVRAALGGKPFYAVHAQSSSILRWSQIRSIPTLSCFLRGVCASDSQNTKH